jgi:ADP-ribose pyrophosphatase
MDWETVWGRFSRLVERCVEIEKTLSSRLLHEGRKFDFLVDEVELPNGHVTQRDIVRHPGAVVIIPILGDGRVVLIRQFRYAAGKAILEIPAGTLEVGEPPLECAARELREETGYAAKELEPLLSCFMAPGYSDEVIHFFVERGLTAVGDDPEIDEEITLELHGLEEVRRMIAENVIEDAKTIVGILSMN